MTSAPTGLARWLPITSWARHYRRRDVTGDFTGALTAWAIVVPESVAYAEIAGVPPQNAFYAAPVALLAYALFGSSRYLIVGATSAAAILSASTVGAISASPSVRIELSAALAIIVGVILLLAGAARLGFITNFLAESALQGFLFGMALLIVVRQVAKIVGVSSGDGDFFARAWHLLRHVGDWSLASILVGLVAVGALLALERFVPRLPASLTVLILGIVASAAFHLEDHGVAIVGKIPPSVSHLHVPDVSVHQSVQLLGGAFGLALVVFAESYSISNRFAQQHGSEVNADQEMIAMGAANLAAGAFSGFAVSGSASRTASAEEAGARTQLASVIAAVLVLITAAFLTPLFTKLPEPILGAIVIVAVRGFLRTGPFRRYWRQDRSSLAIAGAAAAGVLVFDLLPGLLIAVALSLTLFIARATETVLVRLGRDERGAWLDVAYHPAARTEKGVLVLRPDGPLFFGNAERIRQAVLAAAADAPPPTRVVVVLAASYRLSVPVLDALTELEAQLARDGHQLWLAVVPTRARDALDHDALADRLEPGRIAATIDGAVAGVGQDAS